MNKNLKIALIVAGVVINGAVVAFVVWSNNAKPSKPLPPIIPAEVARSAPAREPEREMESPVVIDAVSVGGRNEAQVAQVLGPPSSCEAVKQGRRCPYVAALAEVEIVFIGGKATLITITPKAPPAFESQSLRLFGFHAIASPAVDTAAVRRWKGLEGADEVSMFPGQAGRMDYLYVKWAGPPVPRQGLDLDLPLLVGGSKADVDGALGEESKDCNNSGRRAQVCLYRAESLKVTFVDKKADRFLLTGDWKIPSGAAALPRLGIKPPGRASFQSDLLWRWTEHDGFREITVESGGSGLASKVLIKAKHGDEVFQ